MVTSSAGVNGEQRAGALQGGEAVALPHQLPGRQAAAQQPSSAPGAEVVAGLTEFPP